METQGISFFMIADLDPTNQQDFIAWLQEQQGRQYDLHSKHINPTFVKMLKTIGFDKSYVRGQGCYLWDAQGNKYLDLLTGWGALRPRDATTRK